ncbi:uncharacterized protein LOC128228579 isoform X2 [Mya arenaria]|uniref:uncharacterized protein LOC128228579 isoform X2 n=1 Tax=Mya arenaria TaxID=6604 RepID=UPI0022E17270|nr:uncharacterized protein LOC128228579 isoform X2 [Mya arenaria]
MDRELTSLLVLLILNTFINDAVSVSQCDPAANGLFSFGPKCEYLCHCQGKQKCNDVTGACHNGCDEHWFGPACQYYDVAFNVLSRQLDNLPEPRYSFKANEGNPNTCSYTNFESAANERQIPPYWIIFFKKDVYLSKIELQSFPSAIYQGYYDRFKIYIENYPSNKTSTSTRNYIPPAKDRLLCYQHDGLNTPSANMAINCGRSLPGNSARIELRNRSTQLVLCDFRINVGRNVAFDKPASYSFGNGHNSKPGLAVDGIKHLTCVYVFASDPWWEVDLGTILQVNRIVISENNRKFLLGYVVETAQVPGGNRTTLFADDLGRASTEIYTYIEARFVRITRPGENKTLALCEVEVFAECRNLRWGDLCENKCGHCLDDYCYDWNGYCKNGCESGYKTTDKCLDECEDGRFGNGCFGNCGHCLDGLACNKTTGFCDQGCAPGWTALPTCKHECQGDTYGLMCHSSCSHNCKAGCNKVDGACNGCADGLKGKFCECEDGRFGKGCFGTCGHCLDGLACNKTTGFCDQGCAPGWTALPTCKHECQGDTYGLMCHSSCSHNCKAGCNKVNGACNGCADGLKGNFCDVKEEQGFNAFEFAGVAGGSMGGCLLLLGLVFASVLVYRRYKSTPKKRDLNYAIPDINLVDTGRAYRDLYEIPVKKSNEDLYYQTLQI